MRRLTLAMVGRRERLASSLFLSLLRVSTLHTSRHYFMVGMPYNLGEEGDN